MLCLFQKTKAEAKIIEAPAKILVAPDVGVVVLAAVVLLERLAPLSIMAVVLENF